MRSYRGLLNSESLPENGVFVFGSNPIGINGNPIKGTGGAALVAMLEFGVKHREIMDNCLSESGKAYGLVTVDAPKKYISETRIKENIETFYAFARETPDKDFYVAYDGKNPNAVSLNGKTRKTLANLFYQAGISGGVILRIPENIVFEEKFAELIEKCRQTKSIKSIF
jgi:hypothetical protein